MNQSDLLNAIEDILEVDAGTVALSDALDDLGWDSLANISFISEIDQRASIQVDARALSDATTVGDLVALVLTHA